MARVVRKPGPGMEQLKNALAALDDKVGKVGWFESAKYPDGTPVAYVAAIQEFGYAAGGIPPRPMLRSTINEQSAAWIALVTSGAKAIMAGNSTTQNVMEALGLLAAADVRKKISTITEPALKPGTIKARMRKRADKKTVGNLTKPLVDSGLMLATVNNTVEDR